MTSMWGERAIESPALKVEVRPLMRLVYLWMGLGLLVTALIALVTANPASALGRLLYTYRAGQLVGFNSGLFYGGMILELALVLGLNLGFNRLSPGVAAALFFVYAAVNGFTLSIITLVYVQSSIVTALVSTAALFGVMTVVGFTTQVDLSRYSTYFMMGLIGLVIAMVVNMFLGSGPFDMVISMFGVVLFTALTAYDTQRIRDTLGNLEIQSDGNLALKFSVMGALHLYLDFINLFLFLLRLFGRRR